jgi:ammonium transporter Rh
MPGHHAPSGKDNNGNFPFFIFLEAIIIILYGLFTTYDTTGDTQTAQNSAALSEYYAMYQDVHVMIFVGFGFLMTFLRRYGYGAVAITFFLSAFALQWAILTNNFWLQVFHQQFHQIKINIVELIHADFCAASIMISFGGVIGKVC